MTVAQDLFIDSASCKSTRTNPAREDKKHERAVSRTIAARASKGETWTGSSLLGHSYM